MNKEYTSLGLMSGTSGDGVDASIIQSNGESGYIAIKDKYFKYDERIYQNIHFLKDKIHNLKDLKLLNKEINELERKITLFHSKIVQELNISNKIDIVGFHGQTIYHNSKEKISKQLGNAKLLSQLTRKNIIYNFRQNDIKNGGEGAPLTPIFHQLIATQNKFKLPVCILNIGGISNITIIHEPTGSLGFSSRDIGPGNCLIDSWVRKNSKKKFDLDGILASQGNKNEIVFETAQELFSNRLNKNSFSFDTNDFDISFARGLSLEDGAATLTDFTASIIGSSITSLLENIKNENIKVLICGGGRKNSVLTEKISKIVSKNISINLIDDYGLDGDFIESQAFAFLAIRSNLKLPISFPSTTRCRKPTIGGQIIKIK
tara:strand:- start:716 stop:1840 length:1125 start_codon:yes stop_codon:yes gene_type:complete